MKSVLPLMLAAITAIVYCTGCASAEIGESKDVNPETVYQQYTVYVDQNEQTAVGTAVFRFAGEDGTTLVLSSPSSVSFDGARLKVDSSEFEGAFYRHNIPAGSFEGLHQFVFTSFTGAEYRNEFQAAVPKLKAPFSASKREPLLIYLDGLADGEYTAEVAASGTDSSFTVSSAISHKAHYLEIPAEQLQRQKTNRLTLNVSVTRRIPLQQATREGGSFAIEYTLKPVEISLDESLPVTMAAKR